MKPERGLVLITTSFPIAADGSEAAGSFVSDLAEELAKHIPVRVVAPGPRSVHEKWRERVDVFRYAAPERPLSTLKPWKPSDLRKILGVLSEGEAATRKAVEAGPTCHMLALWALPSGHWARRISCKTNVPYSVWTLGSDIWTLGKVPVLRGRIKNILRRAEHIYSDGLDLAEQTRNISGCDVEFLPSTRRIENNRVVPPRTKPPYRLLYLGRWHYNKGIDLLIDGLEALSSSHWKKIESIQICGGGPLEPIVRDGVARLKLKGHPVCLRGFLDKSESQEAILQSDYLIIPSRVESIPLIFSDAIKLGRPIISTPIGDLPDLMSRQNIGVLAETVSAIAISRAIGRALDENVPSNRSQNITEMADQFSLDRVGSRIMGRISGPAVGAEGETWRSKWKL